MHDAFIWEGEGGGSEGMMIDYFEMQGSHYIEN